jgi:hypothetical protein
MHSFGNDGKAEGRFVSLTGVAVWLAAVDIQTWKIYRCGVSIAHGASFLSDNLCTTPLNSFLISTNIPYLNAQYIKFVTLVTEWFIAKCWAFITNARLEVVVQP